MDVILGVNIWISYTREGNLAIVFFLIFLNIQTYFWNENSVARQIISVMERKLSHTNCYINIKDVCLKANPRKWKFSQEATKLYIPVVKTYYLSANKTIIDFIAFLLLNLFCRKFMILYYSYLNKKLFVKNDTYMVLDLNKRYILVKKSIYHKAHKTSPW